MSSAAQGDRGSQTGDAGTNHGDLRGHESRQYLARTLPGRPNTPPRSDCSDPQRAKIWYQVVTAFLSRHVLNRDIGLPDTLG
jgi:hypothetical protein